MATAASSSSAHKILLPLTRDHTEIVGYKAEPLPHLLEDALMNIRHQLNSIPK
jgi:hypothetical protein